MALRRDPYLATRQLAGVDDPARAPDPALTAEQLQLEADLAANAQRSEVGKALNQGLEQGRGALVAARGLLRVPFDEQAALGDFRESQNIQQRAQALGPRVQNFDQVQDAGDFGEWLLNNTATQIPNIAASVASGGSAAAGRVAAGSLARNAAINAAARGAAANVAENSLERRGVEAILARSGATAAAGSEAGVARSELTDQLTQRAARRIAAQQPARDLAREAQQGVAAGAVASGAIQQASIAPDIVLDPNGEGTVGERAAKAATGALATGALEALPIMGLFKRYGLGGGAEAVTGGVLRRVAGNAVEQGLDEAATELAQTAGEKLAHKWVNDNVQVMGPDAYGDYLNAAAGGFFGGAVFGAPAGLRGSGQTSPAYGKMRERVGEIVNKITPDFGTPGERVGPAAPAPDAPSGAAAAPDASFGDAVTGARDAALRGVESLRDGGEQVSARVRDFFEKNFGKADRESSIDDSVNQIFDEVYNADPFEYTTENGTAVYNRPFNRFADPDRARTSVAAGVPVDLAVVASTVPAEREAALSQSGALRAAAQALRGDALASIDSRALQEYASALQPDARKNFIRAAATMQELAAADQVQRDESGRATDAQIATPPAEAENDIARAGMSDVDVAQTTTDPAVLRDPREVYRAVRGTPLRGELAPNAIRVIDAKGKARQTSGEALGSQIAKIKAEQDFQDSTRTMTPRQRNVAAIAQVAADVAQQGGRLDLDTLTTGTKLGRDWTLVPADVAAIRQAAATDQFARRQRGATQGPVDQATARQREAAAAARAPQVERDLINDPGAIDPSEIEQVAGNEGVSESEGLSVLGPRDGRPAELRVSDTGRVSEAQAVDTGNINPESRRQENATQWGEPEIRARVDEGLNRTLGRTPSSAAERRGMIAEARGKLKGEALAQLNQRVYDMANARAKTMDARLGVAREAWQGLRRDYAAAQKAGAPATELAALAQRGREARDAMNTAQERLDRARVQATAERRQVRPSGEPKRKITPRTTDKARVARAVEPEAAERAPDGSGPTPAAAITSPNEIPKTRSRRELDALAQRVVHAAGLSESRRIELLQQIVSRRTELGREITMSGARDIEEGNRSYNATEEHFEAARKALAGQTTVEGAMKAVRSLADKRQRNLIDTLVSTGALRGVKFSETHNAFGDFKPSSGRASGVHYATSSSRALDGTVAIKMAEWAALGDSNTDIVALLIHEAAHAATSHAELENARSRNALKQMVDHAREQAKKAGYDPDSWYGLSETQEFIAEAFGNAEFQKLLESMPAANTTEFRNLWEQFKDFVVKLLGLDSPQATALDEAITVGLDMARQTGEARANTLAAIFGLETAPEFSPMGVANTPSAGARLTDYMEMLPPQERLYLMNAFSQGPVIRQIEAALPPQQRALLNTADLGPQLLVNTGVAMALNNQLDLDAGAKGAVSQLIEQVRKTLQIPSNRAYASQILADIKGGKASRSYSARAQLLNPAAQAVTNFIDTKVTPAITTLASDIDSRMRETGVPALNQLATLMSQRTGEFRSDKASSFTAARNRERGKRLNDFYQIINGWTDAKKKEVTRQLQRKDITKVSPEAREVLDFFKGQYDYLTGAGLQLGKTENYFPVTMDGEAVGKNKQAFIDLLNEPNLKTFTDSKGGADKLYETAIRSTGRGEQSVAGVTFADGDAPNFRALNERLSAYVYENGTPAQIEAFSKFQDPNLERIAVNYINRATSRAEWSRLGLDDRIKSLLLKAKKEGATPAQRRMARDYIDQIMGVYGQDWHPIIKRALTAADNVLGTKLASIDFAKAKGLQSALMTYQNVRLLPLALASSLIDPLGGSIRSGGEISAHFKSMRESMRAIRDKGGTNALRAMAEDMGVIERNAVNEALVYLYGGAHDPSGRLAKINNALFKYNGLELVTKFSRLTALAMGHKFLLKHAASKDGTRYLSELGLTAADVKDDGTGHVVRNDKIDAALTRFVDESVVRPTPGQRPSWHNDPHFALAAQYKGYLYSFWNTVMRRAAVELRNGNYRVLAPLAMYLPVTAVGEMMRDALQDDDDDRDMVDYAKLSVERSGLLGPKINLIQSAQQDVQFGSSALNSLLGPTGQQLGQMYDTLNGQRGVSKTAVEALPGSALFEEWGSP